MEDKVKEITQDVYTTEHTGGNLEHQNKNKILKSYRENKNNHIDYL